MGAAAREKIDRALRRHADYVDRLTDALREDLEVITHTAQARTLAELNDSLELAGNRIMRTRRNMAALRKIDRVVESAFERAGYREAVEGFVDSFGGQMVHFDEILEAIGDVTGERLTVKFTARDCDMFAMQQVNTLDTLETVVTTAAADTKRRALFSVAAMSYADFVDEIARRFGKTTSEAVTLGQTGMEMFFRTVTDRGFQIIEDGLPGGSVTYLYEGPSDRITRPFCRRMLSLAGKRGKTREWIDRQDNGQIPNVFTSCGGWNCRHQWMIEGISK